MTNKLQPPAESYAEYITRKYPRLGPRNRRWRVEFFGFSMKSDDALFFVSYKALGLFWRTIGSPEGFGYLAFTSNADAVEWIKTRSPRSIVESGALPERKPRGWNEAQYLAGRFGPDRQREAFVRLVYKSHTP